MALGAVTYQTSIRIVIGVTALSLKLIIKTGTGAYGVQSEHEQIAHRWVIMTPCIQALMFYENHEL